MSPDQNIKYRKPPIVEVVCEFKFVPTGTWDLAIPGLVFEQLKKHFPYRRTIRGLQTKTSIEAQEIRQGFNLTELSRFLRQDEAAFVQVGSNLLSINHVKPYPTWEVYKPMILKGLKAYSGVANPGGLQRIGLRYINRIETIGEPVSLRAYLNFRPYIGPKLPREVSDFLMGIQTYYDDGRDVLRLQLASTDSENPETTAFLLDLDYFLHRPGSVGIPQVDEWLEVAHTRVQSVFEACLTDKLRYTFEAH